MNYAKLIDHTILKPETEESKIINLCNEAIQYGFASVCVNPCHVALCAKLLRDKEPVVCTVIGFPLGANTTKVKGFETNDAVENGADEIDMVINIGALKDHKDEYVMQDIRHVVECARGKLVKVIIETCLLTEEEKHRACRLALEAGADFVKTSTGFSSGGATVADIALMRKIVGPNIGVKASGGVRSKEDMEALIMAGATRIGTSSGPKLINNQLINGGY